MTTSKGKRRRSHSIHDDQVVSRKSRDAPSSSSQNNPILSATNDDDDDASLYRTTRLLELVMEWESLQEDKEKKQDFCRTTVLLLKEISNPPPQDDDDHEDADSSWLTHIALLLLPYAVKRILTQEKRNVSNNSNNNDDSSLEYQVLSVTLERLTRKETASTSTSSATTSTILSQSTLHKLLPILLTQALPVESDKNPESTTREWACQSLQLLLTHYYRPSLEIACQSLLGGIVVTSQQPIHAPTTSVTMLARMVLNWMQAHVMQTANPKTMFLLFASPAVLLIWAKLNSTCRSSNSCSNNKDTNAVDVQTRIESMLLTGLFHPKQHMEGFVSLLLTLQQKKKTAAEEQKTFQCYQQTLLSTLGSMVAASSDDNDDCIHVLRIIPVLLHAFFTATQEWWEMQQVKQSRKNQTNRLAFVQFQMFRQVMMILEQRLAVSTATTTTTTTTTAAAASMEMSLQLLLEFNVYLPSQDDADATQFRCLGNLKEQLLDVGTNLPQGGDVATLASILQGLNHLIYLDHRMVSSDETLQKVLTFCLECSCRDDKLTVHVIQTLTTVVDTFEKLREQTRWLEIFIAFLGAQSGRKEYEQLSLWLANDKLVRTIVHSIDGCPFGQVESMFIALAKRAKQLLDRSKEMEQELPVLVMLAVLVIQHVRVEKEHASELAGWSRDFVQTILPPAAQGTFICVTKRKAVLSLCAWCIQLNTRAAFWMGQSLELPIPAALMQENWVHAGAADNSRAAYSDGNEEGGDELLLLLGHRLRELHSLIYESERPEVQEKDSEGKLRLALVTEAIKLAARVAEIANRHLSENETAFRWEFVARNCFSSWICYASQAHVDAFLLWLFRSLSNEEDNSEGMKVLLQDASFYEHELIMSRLSLMAVNISKEWIQQACLLIKAKGGESVCIRIESLKDQEKYSFAVCLQRAAVSINIMNGVLRSSKCRTLSQGCVEAAKAALDLDIQISFFVCGSSQITGTVHTLCGSLRQLVGYCMAEWSEKNIDSFLHGRNISDETRRLFQSCTSVQSNTEGSTWAALFTGTGSLIYEMVRMMLSAKSTRDASTLKSWVNEMYSRTGCNTATIHISRSLLRGLVDNRCHIEVTELLFKKLWNLIVLKVEACTDNPMSNGDSGDDDERDAMFWLFGDLLQLSRSQHWTEDHWPRHDVKTNIERQCIAGLSAKTTSSTWYALGCLAMTNLPSEISQKIMEHIIVMFGQSSPLIDAAFRHLLGRMTESEIRVALNQLLAVAEDPEKDVSCQIRLLGICLKSIDEEKSGSVLNEYGNRIYTVLLSRMGTRPLERDSVMAACSALDELLYNRRIFIFRDFDLTRLLFHISAVVGYNGPTIEMPAMPTEVFTACTRLFSTTFQRYTKHLYGCVPSVVLVVQTFLARVLYETDLSDEDIMERAQRFARVCEQFVAHKDIYKKHVLGLILEYLHAVQNDLSLVRKQSLIPSLYLIIDTLSSHELKQLNAMMEPSAKIVFRGIYHTYQKMHAFKGQ
jgi:hypothetical protein